MLSASAGSSRPRSESSATTGSSRALTHRKYISSTEIRKFGRELATKLKKRTMWSSAVSFFSAVSTLSGSETTSESASEPSARSAV